MMSLLIKLFIKNNEEVMTRSMKRAYASLSSIAGILLNLFLCISKIVIGHISNSIAISADGYNNLCDAATSLAALLGFKIAGYGSGSAHPFGHGRVEWIVGIFTSLAVCFMGIQLAGSSIKAIISPKKTVFGAAVVIVLILSILVKGYMYLYNRKFSKIIDSETLKATASDCISDLLATSAVLLSTIISYVTNIEIDGYCGAFVSIFIVIAGIKSLWEVLGRIMGKAANQEVLEDVLQNTRNHPAIKSVHNLMVHDYGFGYFVICLHVEGDKKESEKLYAAVSEISRNLYRKYHCDTFIQIDYLMDDQMLEKQLLQKLNTEIHKYGDNISVGHFRLIEGGACTNIVFDLIYPADLQKTEEEICLNLEQKMQADNQQYYTTIKGIIRRERFSLQR